MKIEFNKNVQFTRLIKANGYLREFNFRKINSTPHPLFSVDVSDEKGNRRMFKMQKEKDKWRVQQSEDYPEWIIRNESLLNEMIQEELLKNE